jgi:hypothetical protein
MLFGLVSQVSGSSAEGMPSFATASIDSKGSALASFTAGALSSSSSTTEQLIGISSDASSALWLSTITATSSVLIHRTKSGVATLFPKNLIDSQKSLHPTPNGVVIQQGSTFSYLSADSAFAGTDPIKIGSIPKASAGFFRDVSSITAVDGAVYVSTVDYQIAVTDPTMGLSHLWYINGDSSKEALSGTGQYITSMQISPAEPTKFAAIFIRIGNRSTFYGTAMGTILSDQTVTIDESITWMATSPAMIDQTLGWLSQDGTYIPAIVDVLSSNTTIHTFAGATLALYVSKSNVVLSPTLTTFDTAAVIRNKIQRTITTAPALLPVLPYNTVLKNTGSVNLASLGYTDAVRVPLSITIGTKKSSFAVNRKATANFCLSGAVPEVGALAAATGSFCAKVQAMLKVTANKRVFTVLTSSTKLIVQTYVKKKWTVAKLKFKVVKGKAVITVPKGSYKFSIAATASNAAIASKTFTIK